MTANNLPAEKTVSVTFTHDEIGMVAGAIADAVEVVDALGVPVPRMLAGLHTKLLTAHALVCPQEDGLIPAAVLALGVDGVTVNGGN